jgi:capsid portal protein
MKIFGMQFGSKAPEVEKVVTINSPEDIFKMVQLSRPELPVITESRNLDYIQFGIGNNYPQLLIRALETSAIHNAIVLTKSKMMAGQDILANGQKFDDYLKTITDINKYAYLKTFYEDPTGTGEMTLNGLNYNLSYDYQIFGAFALEIIWSLDFTRIVQMKHIDVSNIRSGKLDESQEVCTYFYSRNWQDLKNNPKIEIAKFDVNDKEHYNQLIYVKQYKPGLQYYGIPEYSSALSWIEIDGKMSEFHLANITNGMSPSMVLKFYKKPGSPEERDEVTRNVLKQFTGSKNAGKIMVMFSDGKELAPDVQPIENATIDQMFINLGDSVVQNILSAHRVTSSQLFGISTPGKLGTSGNELVTAYNIFEKEVIVPSQNVLLRVLNRISKLNGYDIDLSIEQLLSEEDLTLTTNKPA